MSIRNAFVIVVVLLPLSLCGDEAPAADAHHFQILQRKEVQAGDHSIIFNRVVPPPKTPLVEGAAPSAVVAEGAESDAEEKPTKGLSLSATVYDREVTLLRWFHEGREYRVFSNIDFNYVAGLGSFETTDTLYSFVMGLGNSTREQAELDRAAGVARGAPASTLSRVPLLSAFDATRAEYGVLEGSPIPPSEALVALEALHQHFETNREALIARYHERLAAQAERERYAREHPPIPKDTVINYWPEKSQVYLSDDQSEGQP